MTMTLASILMLIAITAAALGLTGFMTGLAYAVFFATLGFLGIHILLNAIEEDSHHADRGESLPNSLAKP